MLRRFRICAAVAIVAASIGTAHSEELVLRMFPWPGSRTASPQTQISFRGAPPGDIGEVVVVGAGSGFHSGVLKGHADGRGASFLPDQPFVPGEIVAVQAQHPITGADTGPAQFTVAIPVDHEPTRAETVDPESPGWKSYWTFPGVRAPVMNIHTASADRRSGVLMLTQSRGPSGSGPMILDQTGRLVWFRPLPEGVSAADFRARTYRERPVLTWWEGALSFGQGFGEHVVLNHSYRELFRIRAGNGYLSDLHDLWLGDDGTAYVLIYNWIRWNPTPLGGGPGSAVVDGVIQQIDIPTGLVLFEWHSLDHIGLDESYAQVQPTSAFDYVHLNSVERLPSGDLLVSARHTSAVYILDGISGRVLWRLGGRVSDFEIPPEGRFAFQHDARLLPNGIVSIFDNGAGPIQERSFSRGLYLQLDFLGKRVASVRDLIHPQRVLASSQGSMQTLANGHSFIGWGSRPFVTQHDPDGNVVFHASLAHGNSYRAYRMPWNGRPAYAPRFTVHRSGPSVVAYVSWNGDTQTRTWQLLGGDSVRRLKPIASIKRTSFETVLRVQETDARYFAVRALDARGRELRRSPVRVI